MSLRNHPVTISVTMTAAIGTTEAFQMAGYDVGAMHIGTSTPASVTWYGASTEDGTYRVLRDDANTGGVASTLTNDAVVSLPSDLSFQASAWVKAVTNASSVTLDITLDNN